MSGSDSKRWNWLEEGLIPLVSAMMLAACLRPLFQLILSWRLVQPADMRYPAWLIVCIPLAATALQNALQKRERGRLWMVGASVAIILVALVYLSPSGDSFWQKPLTTLGETIASVGRFRGHIPAMLLMLIMTAALIVRGLLADWMSHEELWQVFLLGVVILGVLMVLPTSVGDSLALGSAVALFLMWGLLALALLSVGNMLYTQRSLGRKVPMISRYWLIVICVAVGAVVLGGWALGLFFSPETVAEIVAWLDPVRRAVGQLIQWIVIGIVYVLFLVLEPLINWLRNLLAKTEVEAIDLTSPFAKQLEELQEQATETNSSIPWGMIAAIIVVVVILVVLILAWRRRQQMRPKAGVDEQREYIGSLDLFLSQLRDLLNSHKPRITPFLGTLNAADPRQRIRLLYRRLLTAARSIEQPRLRGQTPAAYARRLARLQPARADDLQVLTEAYHLARYADKAPSGDVVNKAEQATARIEQTFTH